MTRFLPGLPAALSAALVLAGCTAGPDYARPPLPGSSAIEEGVFLRAGEATAAIPAARWWEGLGDPVLSALVEEGLARAPTVDAALARIRQARAGITSARASLFPVLSASATYAYADLPNEAFGTGGGSNEFVTLGFDTQWEADLWGGARRDVERTRAEAAEAEARLADVRVSLSAEIARTYVTLQARQAALALLDRRRADEARLLDLATQRLRAGTGTGQEVAAAKRRTGRTDAELAGLQSETAVLRDSLAVLTGQAPGARDSLAIAAIPLPPAEVAVGDPAAMLARRPDVLAAEAKLRAATAKIGVAKARTFPAISLLGLIGIGGSSIGDVFDTSQLSAIAVPRLTWNFLDFGRNKAAVTGAEAAREAALAEYRAGVLAALQDAEAALARFGAARIGLATAGDGLEQARTAARLEAQRGRAGTISRSQVLDAECDRIDAELAEANARARLTLSYIALAKSLGLGWQAGHSELVDD